MISADSFAPGWLGIVTSTLSAEFSQAREAIERCSSGLPDDTASRQVGASLRRVAGVLEMVGAPIQARFLLELAEIALSGASSNARAAYVAAGCLGAVASELGTAAATTLHRCSRSFLSIDREPLSFMLSVCRFPRAARSCACSDWTGPRIWRLRSTARLPRWHNPTSPSRRSARGVSRRPSAA